MADVRKGQDFNLYYTINGYSYPACHAQDCKITGVADTQETTTKNSRRGKTFDAQGKYSYTLELKGITNFVDYANIGQFNTALMTGSKLPFLFTDASGISWSGTVLITQVAMDSPVSALSTFTNSMLLDGDLVQVTTGVVPPIPGGSVLIKDQFGNTLATVVAPGTYNVLKFDTIDQRGWMAPDLLIIPAS